MNLRGVVLMKITELLNLMCLMIRFYLINQKVKLSIASPYHGDIMYGIIGYTRWEHTLAALLFNIFIILKHTN